MAEGFCFFCNVLKENTGILLQNDSFFTRLDPFPVSKGHTLMISKKHESSFFDMGEKELADLVDIMKQAKAMLDLDHSPDGYNIGINEGEAAGQTIPHLHIHLIPRYKDDVDDPVGGVRNIIPGKGNYLKR